MRRTRGGTAHVRCRWRAEGAPRAAMAERVPRGCCCVQEKTPRGLMMAGLEEAVLDLPWREDGQAATTRPILLPNLKGSCFDHPLYEGLLHPTRRLCSPTSAPASKSSKKPKMQAAGNTFSNDWSPPPVEFLNLSIPQANRGDPAPGPRALRRLAYQHPEVSEQEPQDLDRLRGLVSLGEPFWNVTGTSPEAATPGMGAHTLLASGSSGCYVNSLDYLLQEKREQEQEKLLLLDCADLRAWDLNEDEVLLTPEHRKLVERFSVPLQVIPAVHPGETVFLPRRHPVPCILDSSQLKPRSPLEKLFLSSSPARQLTFLRQGLLSSVYLPVGDRPMPLLRWLLQLLTWPPETSSRAFGLLWDLSLDGLFRQSDGDTNLWCPSLQEVSATFRSLGAHSPALQPLGPIQHTGSEASLSHSEQQDTFQEMALDSSLNYICKFLTLCALAQPGAYTDRNLLDLIELLCRAGLDTRLRLLPKTDLQQLLLQLLENIREWPGKLRQLCCALSRASDHHHNLLALVQLFLDVTPRSRSVCSCSYLEWRSPGGVVVKNLPASAGDLGSTPGSRRCPGEGTGTPLQRSCLENPLDRGAWRATVHGAAKSRTQHSSSTTIAASSGTSSHLPARLPWVPSRETRSLHRHSQLLLCSLFVLWLHLTVMSLPGLAPHRLH